MLTWAWQVEERVWDVLKWLPKKGQALLIYLNIMTFSSSAILNPNIAKFCSLFFIHERFSSIGLKPLVLLSIYSITQKQYCVVFHFYYSKNKCNVLEIC